MVEDPAVVSAFYSLPDTLIKRDGLKKLRDRCQKGLLDKFGDVLGIMAEWSGSEDEIRVQFRDLPAAAVMDWSSLDELRVQNENCVVALLSYWVQAHPECDSEVHCQLAKNVRVQHVSMNYLISVLPNLKWFRSSKYFKYLSLIQMAKHSELELSSASWARQLRGSSWLDDARDKTELDWDDWDWNFTLGEEEQNNLFLGTTWNSGVVYNSGFHYKLEITHGESLDHALTLAVDWARLDKILGPMDSPILVLMPSKVEVHIPGTDIRFNFETSLHLCSVSRSKRLVENDFLATSSDDEWASFRALVEARSDDNGNFVFKLWMSDRVDEVSDTDE